MVIVEDARGAVCVGQAAHAWISGQLARRWGNERFAPPEPFEEFCLGAEQHDVGMAEWDLRPTLDPSTGRPTHFMAMPLATHLRLWTEAPRRALTQSPYAALLISLHGHALYARRSARQPGTDAARAVAAYVAEQEAFQADLLDRLGEPEDRARHNQRLLWALDFLSLALLLGWAPGSVPAPTRAGAAGVELTVRPDGERRVTVDPWPFGPRELTVRTAGRLLTDRHDDEEAMRAALDRAPWATLAYVLASP